MGSGRDLGKPGLEFSFYPAWLCDSDCGSGLQFLPLCNGTRCQAPGLAVILFPSGIATQATTNYPKVRETETCGRRADVTGHHHSPRAQKTLNLLESGKDTFKTSLWLSKSASGPPQLSTIGDMSCRSGRVASETNEPNRDTPPSLSPSLPHFHHSPSGDLKWLTCRSSLDPCLTSLSQFTNRMAPEPPGPQRHVFCDTQEGLG